MNLTKRFIITNMLGHPICKLRRFLYKSPKSISFNTQPSTKSKFKIIPYFSIFEPLGLNEDNDRSVFFNCSLLEKLSIEQQSNRIQYWPPGWKVSDAKEKVSWPWSAGKQGEHSSCGNDQMYDIFTFVVRWRDFYPLLTFQSISNAFIMALLSLSCK